MQSDCFHIPFAQVVLNDIPMLRFAMFHQLEYAEIMNCNDGLSIDISDAFLLGIKSQPQIIQ